MAVVPSNPLYSRATPSVESLQSSVSNFNITLTLQFFRSGSYNFCKKQKFFATHGTTNARTILGRNSQPESNCVLRKTNNMWELASETSALETNASLSSRNCNCFGNWDEIRKQRNSKTHLTVSSYRNGGNVEGSSSTSGSGGGTMERIVEKLKKYGYVDDVNDSKEKSEKVTEMGSIEDIFYVEDGLFPSSRGSLSNKPALRDDDVFKHVGEVRFPWEKELEEEKRSNSMRLKSKTALAELTLPESELRRLRYVAFRVKHKTRVSGSIVSKEVLDIIHQKWKTSEVVRLKIEGPAALNMKRMHEILERKTGGLVIWRSGTSVALYRGASYENPSERVKKRIHAKNKVFHDSPSTTPDITGKYPSNILMNENPRPQADTLSSFEERNTEPQPEMKYEEEVDRMLDGLGPRYMDWLGRKPKPVDADLLPGIVPGFQPPFRVLPYGVRYTLRIKEATDLRRLAKVLPPHFALGRSRQHQGLAVAMIKLWERSSIVKIALKRGVQLTTSERMAEDIKKLTGGVLLSRSKDFLVFFRGKDFLSPVVSEALLEKERLAKALQDDEEQARLKASSLATSSAEVTKEYGTAGTLEETLDADAKWGKRLDEHHGEFIMKEAELAKHANLVRKLERKLAFAERKLSKAERALCKVEECLNPVGRQADPESISDEERFMFRKLGLRMKAFLLLGRRGVFGGTVENMHLHWKYRELVKLIVKSKNFDQVKKIALSLEAESGGVLVSVDKVSKGYAIIVFRGKDYNRPPELRPKNLLTKRKALARSIELQRREALLKHSSNLRARVETLRSELEQMAIVKDQGDATLYDKLDSAYSTEDEESEVEGEEAYLETYKSDDDVGTETYDSIPNFDLETTFLYDSQDEESETLIEE